MIAYFERFEILMTQAQAETAKGPGDITEPVRELLTFKSITRQLDRIGPEKIRAELKEYGAWDADELADDQANRERIIWQATAKIIHKE